MAFDKDFERFLGGPTQARQHRLHVSLSPARHIFLNRNAYELMGRPGAVRLYYSEKRGAIGIERASASFNDAFPVMQDRPSVFRISAAPFCRHFNISVETTVKFISPEFEGETLLLNLNDTIAVARRRKKKGRIENSEVRIEN